MIVNATVTAAFVVNETFTFGFAVGKSIEDRIDPNYSLPNGTADSLVDLHWEKKGVVLAAGASVTYTLSALTDDLARTVAFAKVRALILRPTVRTPGDYLTVGAAAANPWLAFLGGTTPTYRVLDLDLKVAGVDGFAVGSGTSDELKILNSGAAPMTFDVGLVGTSV